jgi:hypothetical protein
MLYTLGTHFSASSSHFLAQTIQSVYKVCKKIANAPVMQKHVATKFQACCLAQDSGLNHPPYFTGIPQGTAGNDPPKSVTRLKKCWLVRQWYGQCGRGNPPITTKRSECSEQGEIMHWIVRVTHLLLWKFDNSLSLIVLTCRRVAYILASG